MSTVQRKLYLKRVRFKTGNSKGFQQLPLEALMNAINKKTSSWAQRHWPLPDPDAPTPFPLGTRCLYVTKIGGRTRGEGDGTYFEVGSYVYGRGENQIAVNLSGAEPDIQSGPIVDNNGQHRSILHLYRCVVLGESLIVHKQRGAGSLQDLGSLMAALFRKHIDPKMPSIEFLDVIGTELRDVIEQNGGVESVKISLIDTGSPSKNKPYGKPLFNAAEFISGQGKFTAEWEATAGDALDTDDAINAFEQIETLGDGIGKVSIKPFNGGWITDLGKYQAHDNIDVTIDKHGIEHVTEIRIGLFNYLDQLRIPKGKKNWRIIRDDGCFNYGSETVLVKK